MASDSFGDDVRDLMALFSDLPPLEADAPQNMPALPLLPDAAPPNTPAKAPPEIPAWPIAKSKPKQLKEIPKTPARPKLWKEAKLEDADDVWAHPS